MQSQENLVMINKNNKYKLFWGGVLLLLLLFFTIVIANKFIEHEKRQSFEISLLNGEVSYLENKLDQSINYYNYNIEYSDEAFNYLALGNSLTLIPSIGRGICSTQMDNDYFNLVVKELKTKHNNIVAYPVNYAPWERYSKQRNKTYDIIDVYLVDKLDLVTIQLGENASDITTYEKDLEDLVDYIREKAPKAVIVIIGDFWSQERNQLRLEAAKNKDCLFADLSEIIGDKKYQSKTGTLYYLSDGTMDTVTEAQRTHPGDKGMEYIAQKIINLLELK